MHEKCAPTVTADAPNNSLKMNKDSSREMMLQIYSDRTKRPNNHVSIFQRPQFVAPFLLVAFVANVTQHRQEFNGRHHQHVVPTVSDTLANSINARKPPPFRIEVTASRIVAAVVSIIDRFAVSFSLRAFRFNSIAE